ncbi:PAS domain-containing protein [Hartmannibacter diazotrophicus]|nr:PAS domain-containing protein [Hartmannibacter diazotrophicus]
MLRFIEEKTKIGTWIWDLTATELHWSTGLYRLIGLDPQETKPSFSAYESIIHPDDHLDITGPLVRADGSTIFDRQFRIMRRDGSLRWLQGHAEIHLGADEMPHQVIGVVIDITDRKILSDSLKLAGRHLDLASDILGAAVWITDRQGSIVSQHGWLPLTGQSVADVQQMGWLNALVPEDRVQAMKVWMTSLRRPEPFEIGFRVRSSDDEGVAVTGRFTPLEDRKGGIAEWIGVFRRQGSDARALQDHVPAGEEGSGEHRLHPAQIRAARAMLGWSVSDLADVSGISGSTIRRMEMDDPDRSVSQTYFDIMHETFRRHGLRMELRDGMAVVGFPMSP